MTEEKKIMHDNIYLKIDIFHYNIKKFIYKHDAKMHD
jgi:hypothetical protein